MTVYIASMNCRGTWAQAPASAAKLNVTSAQAKNMARRDFSPMSPVEGTYKGYWNFESYWQSGKVFEDIPHDTSRTWWLRNCEAKRRYPGSKDKRVLYAMFDHINEPLDYIESRKQVYVPEYYDLIKDREATQQWQHRVAHGNDVIIYDFDGPRNADGSVTCLPLDRDLLTAKLNDPATPFGHGYVVGALLLGIHYDEFVR
jgi:hypothetical protein